MNILLTPARIGRVEIKNRIVMPPMTTRTADDEGFVTEDTIAYYMARVDGGVGLITVEMASPERVGRRRRRELGSEGERCPPGLSRPAEATRRGGAKAAIQLGGSPPPAARGRAGSGRHKCQARGGGGG